MTTSRTLRLAPILLTLTCCSAAFPLLGGKNTTDPRIGAVVSDVVDQYVSAGATCRPRTRDEVLCDLINCSGCRVRTQSVLLTFDTKTYKVLRADAI